MDEVLVNRLGGLSLPKVANSFLYELTPTDKGGKMKMTELLPLKEYQCPLSLQTGRTCDSSSEEYYNHLQLQECYGSFYCETENFKRSLCENSKIWNTKNDYYTCPYRLFAKKLEGKKSII